MTDKKKQTAEKLKIRLDLSKGNILHEFAHAEDCILNPDIEEYIVNRTAMLKPRDTVEFEVSGSAENAEEFKNALSITFGKKIALARKEMKSKKNLALIMFFIGALLLTAGSLLNEQRIVYEVLIVVSGCFFGTWLSCFSLITTS